MHGIVKSQVAVPSISCVIPVFNGERYLPVALESVFTQTLKTTQIIVVDDGSTDGTPALLANLSDKVVNIRQDNQGPAAARNAGLKRVEGEFVAFLDADDCWHKEKNERQFARFMARPELDLSASYIQNFWIPELAAEELFFRDKSFAKPQLGATGATLFRRSIFDRVGYFDPGNTHRDYLDWLARAREQGAIIEVIPDILLFRRIHHYNLTRNRSTADHDDMFRALKASLDRRRREANEQP